MRSRISCDYCRRRHFKCDLVEPTCNACEVAEIECVRSRSARAGGRPKGSRNKPKVGAPSDTLHHPAQDRSRTLRHGNGLTVVLRPRHDQPRPELVICNESSAAANAGERHWLGAVSSRVLLYQLIPTCKALLGDSGAYLATMRAALAFYERADNELSQPADMLAAPRDLRRPIAQLRHWLDIFVWMPSMVRSAQQIRSSRYTDTVYAAPCDARPRILQLAQSCDRRCRRRHEPAGCARSCAAAHGAGPRLARQRR